MPFEPIETERLKLKPISWETMNEIFTNYPKEEIKEILGHQSDEEYEKEKVKFISGYSSYNKRFILFLLTLKETNEIIGRCGLHNWNQEHQRAELGYALKDTLYMNLGYMSEVVPKIIQFGFEELKLHRIEALVGMNNIASLSLIRKNGFTQEGILREHWLVDGKFETTLAFSLLCKEYNNNPNNT